MLNRLETRLAALVRRSPHTDVVGLARSLLALATLGTLVLNPTAVLFAAGPQEPAGPVCAAARSASAFCLVGPDRLEVVRWVAVAVLAVVASGWRPRWTALAHWYVAWSVGAAVTLTDGGDQVAASLALLLAPIAMTDPRRWHWEPAPDADATSSGARGRLVAHGFLWLVRLQVAGIYLHAAIAKLGQPEWADGTALYYWLGNPVFGLPPWLRGVADPVLTSGVGVTALTWGVIVLEVALAAGLVVEPRRRAPLLAAGLALHAGIVGMGLLSFAVVMFAALVLYLRPVDRPFDLPRRAAWVRAEAGRLATGHRRRAGVSQLGPGRGEPVV